MTVLPIQPFAAVNVAVLRPDGRVLVTRRSQKIREPGLWCLPGGHLEQGEPWKLAAMRELEEETGLVVTQLELFGLYSDPSLTVAGSSKAGDARAHFFCAAYVARSWRGEVRLSDEVDAFEWCLDTELPDPMVRSHPIRVQDVVRFQRQVFVR